jgi:DNA polymerase-1
MDRLAEIHLRYRTIHYEEVVPKAETFDVVDLQSATRYAAEDADITFRLYEVFSRKLKERGLDKLFFELEMPLVRILADMELEGIRLDPSVLETYGLELEKDLAVLQAEIFALVGRPFNINSTRQLQDVLFKDRKLQPVKKTRTGFSTDTSVLEELAAEDPVPAKILQHRTLSKLKSTYVDALPKLVNGKTGRLHTNFQQTGTATGRLSSKDPNLQNIPIKEAEGRRIRGAFVPARGKIFLSADYSQIELVILAHLSGDPALCEAFIKGTDVHKMTASLIFGVPPEAVGGHERRIAKTINFGVMYGMSAFRLARELGISRHDAKRFIDSYFARYGGIQDFIGKTVAGAEATGSVKTILGRERAIYAIRSRNKTEKMGAERVAVNTPIQGSAADIVKLAMLRIDGRIREKKLAARLLLQVHDELIFEVPKEELPVMEDLVRKEMEDAYKLTVPLRVSMETGKSWGEMH